MIAIRINRTDWLELYADTKLDITLSSPVFSDKVVEENSVYNFDIPNTLHNRRILGYPGRVQSINQTITDKSVEVFWNEKPVGSGSAIIKSVTREKIELVAGLNESTFIYKHGKKLITSFEYGGTMTYRDYYNTETESILQVCNGTFPEYPFAYFPVKNLSLFDGSQWETGWRTDALSRPFQNDYKAMVYDPVNETYKYKTGHVSVSPFPYVGFVIEEIFKECGYTIGYNIFREDDNLRRLCIYNPNVIFAVGPNRDYFYIDIAHHLPEMTVAELLAAIKMPFALTFNINERLKTVSIRTFNQLNDVRQQIDYMKSETTEETSKLLRFKVAVDGNDEHAQLRQKPEDVQNSRYRGSVYIEADLSTITSPLEGDTALVLSTYEIHQYLPDQSGAFSWQALCYNIQNTTDTGTEDEEIQEYDQKFTCVFPELNELLTPLTAELITVDTLLSDINLGYTTNNWATPIVDIVGNKKNKPMEPTLAYNDFGLKLMMYWGIGPMLDGPLSYPKGSSTIYEYESVMPGLRFLSLFPNHAYNFIDVYLNRYKKTLQNKKVMKIKKFMTIIELQDIDWTKTVLIDGCLWLTTSVKIAVGHKENAPAEMELTKIW